MKFTFKEKRIIKKLNNGFCLAEITKKGKSPNIFYIQNILSNGDIEAISFSYDKESYIFYNEKKLNVSDIDKIKILSDEEIKNFIEKYYEYTHFDYVLIDENVYKVVGLYMNRFFLDKKKSSEAFNCAIHSMDLRDIKSNKCKFVDLRKENITIYPIYDLSKVILKYLEFMEKVYESISNSRHSWIYLLEK